jgi:hypothetical protein
LKHLGADQRRRGLLRHHRAVLGGDRLNRGIADCACACALAALAAISRPTRAQRIVRIMR